MKVKLFTSRRPRSGFTLVELLTVIAIIAILAAMLLPVLTAAKKAAQKTQAKTEEQGIIQAIEAYDQDYGRFPITADEKTAAYLKGNNDFTVGLVPTPRPNSSWTGVGNGNGYNGTGYSFDYNSNVVAILMDLQNFPNGTQTMNNNHVYNPKQTKYLNTKLSGYNPASSDPNPPGGVDNNGIYRDPWGNPYIISMDTSYDDQCSDYFYCLASVSQQSGQTGFNGLVNVTDTGGNGDHFLFHGKVMVWSAGPDGKMDYTKPGNTDVNKDNVLSWQ